jgi:hypothetical protein
VHIEPTQIPALLASKHQANLAFDPGGGFDLVPCHDHPEPHGNLTAVPRKERLTFKGGENQQGQKKAQFLAYLTNTLILLLCFNMK